MTWMLSAWTWFIGTKVGRWIIGAALVIGALAVAALEMFEKGKRAQAKTDADKDAAADQRAKQEASDAAKRSSDAVRATNDEISKMPNAGTQRVGDAAADSAAGWLRDNANRDQAGS
jgi:type VI protein secretion system component VasK